MTHIIKWTLAVFFNYLAELIKQVFLENLDGASSLGYKQQLFFPKISRPFRTFRACHIYSFSFYRGKRVLLLAEPNTDRHSLA